MTSLPFALVGSIWLLWLLQYNMSTAVWVGVIAVFGIAVETGILMVEFLDKAVEERQRNPGPVSVEDINVAVIEGASRRIRPLVMSVASTVLGLMPLLWESGPGADVSARIAAPVIGGLVSCMVLTVIVLPAAYTIWRRAQVKRGTFAASAAPENTA